MTPTPHKGVIDPLSADGIASSGISGGSHNLQSATSGKQAGIRPVIREWKPPINPALNDEDSETRTALFPIGEFPEPLKTVASELADTYQMPVSLSAMSALAVISGAVGQSAVVTGARRDLTTKLNLYVIPIAGRGSGKGTLGQILTKPLITRSKQLADAYRGKMADFQSEVGLLEAEIKRLHRAASPATGVDREALLEELAGKTKRKDQLKAESNRNTTLWCGDTTSEALFRNLADNGETLFSYSAEAGGPVKVALGKYTADGKGDYDLLLSAYSGDSCRRDRVGSGSRELAEPRLALLWMVQDCVVQEILADREAVERGLTARPLIFDSGANREKDNRQNRSFTLENIWNGCVGSILDARLAANPQSPRVISCDAEAVEIFAKFDDETVDLERGPYSDLPGELSRWRENAIKVAGLFALVEDSHRITPVHATRAVAVVRWCGRSYLSLLDRGRKERLRGDVERILEIIADSPGGEVPVGEVSRRHGISRTRLDMLEKEFPSLMEIHPYPAERPGRPRQVIRRPVNLPNQVN